MTGTVYRSSKGPRVGSWAYLALRQLHKDGGTLAINDWMSALGWRATRGRFNREVLEQLIQFELIAQKRLQVTITEQGIGFLGEPEAPAPKARPAITPPPYVGPIRELSAKNRPAPSVIRPGAFDYCEIPSLHCGTRVPYKSYIKLDDVANKKADA